MRIYYEVNPNDESHIKGTEQCNITNVQPISDDNGNIEKFIVEYEPYDESSECNNINFGFH